MPASSGFLFPLPALLVCAASFASNLDLLNLDGATPGPGLPAGWELRPVKSRQPPEFSVVSDSAGRRLRITGEGKAAWAWRSLDEPILPAGAGTLRWSWRVLQAPHGADLRAARADDAAVRVFVVFGNPHGLFGRGRIVFYSWGNEVNQRSHASGRAHIVGVAGSDEVGETWLSESVDPFADYRGFFGGEPPPITAVGVMQDTDMTGSAAIAEVRELYWLMN